jgi:hypothetical protein
LWYQPLDAEVMKPSNSLKLLAMLLVWILAACAPLQTAHWDQVYGKPVPKEVADTPTAKVTYYQHAKPILDARCVVCHGCYDAPCQLKQEAYEGLLRGINPQRVYDGTRLLGISPTRLFEDAQSTAQWRDQGFYPVLNERSPSGNNNIKLSLMAQSLLLKKNNPLPKNHPLPKAFDFDLGAQHHCPRIENYSEFAEKNPLLGMPFGLPGIAPSEHKVLMNWLSQGAALGERPGISPSAQAQIQQWEAFLNGPSLKQQLVSRYIYEHLFLAQVHFGEDTQEYFRLVRSRTPPGEPLDVIATTRPFDDPKVPRVYYRLRQDNTTPLAKTLMRYALSPARLERWRERFLAPNYPVERLPDYAPERAANPFETFADLPVRARYEFLLEEAQFTIMNFIKGPVCRGQVALNVIQDHFWVFFYSPESQSGEALGQFLRANSQHLRLPAEAGNTLLPLTNWHKYSELQKQYLFAKAQYVNQQGASEERLGLDLLWDGDGGKNPNAALTIFRHSDSASVHQGLIGEAPKTAWVIGYPLLERIHYLLVAGFDVYGNVSHQLLSRLYMDFLRIEGEMNFVSLLPQAEQNKELAFWYRDAEQYLHDYIDIYLRHIGKNPPISYQSSKPKQELYQALQQHLKAAATSPHNLHSSTLRPRTHTALKALQDIKGPALQLLPPVSILRIPTEGVFTLVHIKAYSNLSSLFGEEKRHLPDEDQLLVLRGIVGAYPNAFLQIAPEDLDFAVNQMKNMRTENDYLAFRQRFGITRSHPTFWQFSDELMAYFRQTQPKEAALLDYNRLENR